MHCLFQMVSILTLAYARKAAMDNRGNSSACTLCGCAHSLGLTTSQFIAARDDEFLRSCLALGVPENNVHIYGKGEATHALRIPNLPKMLLPRYWSIISMPFHQPKLVSFLPLQATHSMQTIEGWGVQLRGYKLQVL